MGIYRQGNWSRLWNWLFGPPTYELEPGEVRTALGMRSLVLDLETVVEASAIASRGISARTIYMLTDVAPFEERLIGEADLAGLSPADRKRLVVSFRDGFADATGEISFGDDPTVRISPSPGTTQGGVQNEVARKLLENGRPQVHWKRLRRTLVFLPVLAFLAVWVWLERVQAMPLPGHVFGWLVVALAFTLSVAAYARLNRNRPRVPPHRIRMESRADTAARRADMHKDVKVAAITAPVAIAVALIIAILTGFFHLPGA